MIAYLTDAPTTAVLMIPLALGAIGGWRLTAALARWADRRRESE